MLEGKEVDGSFAGGDGHYSVDVQADGMVVIAASFEKPADAGFMIKNELSAKADIVVLLKMLAAHTSNKVDDKLVDLIEKALGR